MWCVIVRPGIRKGFQDRMVRYIADRMLCHCSGDSYVGAQADGKCIIPDVAGYKGGVGYH